MLRVGIFLGAFSLLCRAQVTIIDTGSTNIPGVTVTVAATGHQAVMLRRDGSRQRLKLTKEMCDRLLRDLKAAGALQELPRAHCMKSVSFGSSIYVEYKGMRSADLSCPQQDARSAALKKDAAEILRAANHP